MTDTKTLDALIEAVERGLPSPTNWRNFSAVPTGDKDNPGPILAHRAYHGSIDAAKDLHEALLPGWFYCIMDGCAEVRWEMEYGEQYIGKAETPARAWLLAILKAYRASL